jgi:hypothetical protein
MEPRGLSFVALSQFTAEWGLCGHGILSGRLSREHCYRAFSQDIEYTEKSKGAKRRTPKSQSSPYAESGR